MKLFLWKLSQDVNNGYDTYDSAVVVAPDRMSAAEIHPARYSDTGEAIYRFDRSDGRWIDNTYDEPALTTSSWCQPNDVTVICIGKASDHLHYGDVVCSSYDAG